MLSGPLAGWNPRPVESTERIAVEPAVALSGLFDCPPPVTGAGDRLPPLWQWVYFLDRPAQRDLGPDGHPASGPFMPPIPHRRRMFAGGRLDCVAPIRVGEEVTRRGELVGWKVKQGRTGELLFVTVRYTFTQAGTLLATEEQDLVYRSNTPGPAGSPSSQPSPRAGTRGDASQADQADEWRIGLRADLVLLFRFSALTYNAHRIHYDAEYATSVEGHAGVVVHGPLLALLCLELPRRFAPGRDISRLSFRARSPLYAGQPFRVTGGPVGGGCEMRVTAPGGASAMTATARFAS